MSYRGDKKKSKGTLCSSMTCTALLNQITSAKEQTNYFTLFLLFFPFSLFWTAFKRLPWRAAFRHHHALEQGDFAALPFRVCQPWLPQVSVSAYQNLLLCSWGIPPPAGRCPASDLLCVLRFHGSPEGQHGAGNSWYAYNHSFKGKEWSSSVGGPSLLTDGSACPSSLMRKNLFQF